MLALADLRPGHRILEPSAGTGALLAAIDAAGGGSTTVAVELDRALAEALATRYRDVRAADFLEEAANLGQFDRIVMNPPFHNGADIAHIGQAVQLLVPGGRLVALCTDGPRQAEALRPLVEENGGTWEPLPAGTFEGTSVRAVLLSVNRG